MTLEDRVEAAARALRDTVEKSSSQQFAYDGEARAILRAAFPELFSTPPQAWIAPWAVTPEMVLAGEEAPGGDAYHYARPESQWTAMRTAHLTSPKAED